MNKRVFWLLFGLILVVQFAVRIIPPQNNNFYFTVDQGSDAVHVREITEYGRILTRGPETSMPGVFAGPGWYYFLAPGYFLFDGDPFGGVFMLILLSLATTALVVWWVSKRVSLVAGLTAGLALQVYWYFYEFSRYAFNPFVTGILTLWQVFLLSDFLSGKRKNYYLAFIPIVLAFNCSVASAIAMLLFQLVVGLWGVKKKILGLKQYLPGIVTLAIFTLPIVLQLAKQLSKSSLVNSGIVGERGFFASTNFPEIALRFSDIFSRSIVPQSLLASIALVSVTAYFLLRQKNKNRFVVNYLFLLVAFWLVSFLFFGSNQAWREWHTLYLYLLTFLSFVLVAVSLPQKAGMVLLGIVFLAQAALFQERYRQYLTTSEDPGILANQLRVLDWIYTYNEEDGFNVYTYSPHVFDFQNQYLFWWYGRKTYGFVPCEYSLYPGFMKYNYIPNSLDYTQPTLGCDKFRFLIIEPGGNQNSYKKWREQVKFERGEKVDETSVGQFKVEKWWIRPRT